MKFMIEFVDSYVMNAFRFFEKFNITISKSSVFTILTYHWGYNRKVFIMCKDVLFLKVVERRAKEIKLTDINRYTREVNEILPLHEQLLFLDEVSFDNRDMLPTKGWFVKGGNPYYRGHFQRTSRMSFLSFTSVHGIVENFHTDGTFDRHALFVFVF